MNLNKIEPNPSDIDLHLFEESIEDKRAAIVDFEKALLDLPQVTPEPKHYFVNGMYARELLMLKGWACTGAMHLKEHIVIIHYGDLLVTDNEGTKRLGPGTYIGKAGTKRALYILEDTLWTAIHTTDKTTVEECEATLVTNSYEEFLKLGSEV
jgi:hypothetical protein